MDPHEEMTEEVVKQISEAVPAFVESLTKMKIQFTALGVIFGAAAGAAVAWGIAYRKAELKYEQIADDEIAEMREHYFAKGLAAEAQAGKGDLAELVKERGYTTPEPEQSVAPPMAVQPPSQVMASEGEPSEEQMGEDDVEGPAGVKVKGQPVTRNVFRENQVKHEWNQHEELRRRTPDRPYVVHYDERFDMEGYSDVSLTYYAEDDVLCDERDEIIDPAGDRDRLVGEANLERFGHGNPDPMIVFVRNDQLEILYEVIKSDGSFAQDVHGMDPQIRHSGEIRGNLERMRRRERHEEH